MMTRIRKCLLLRPLVFLVVAGAWFYFMSTSAAIQHAEFNDRFKDEIRALSGNTR